jgi:uncharacterized protein YegJ (DUF2314 family)
MQRLLVPFLFVAMFSTACNKNTPSIPPVTFIEDDDPQMKAAIEKARATLPEFVRALKAPRPSQTGFSIKTPISDGKITEHMWLNPVTFDGTKYHGTVNNQPDKVKGVRLGSKRSIEPQQVTDWMYLEEKRLVGGFTIRVVRNKLAPKEREDFDRNAPFVLE